MAEPSKFRFSTRILYFVGMLALLDLTIIIPTSVSYFEKMLPPGLDDKEKEKKANLYYGLALSLFSAAQAGVGLVGGYIIALLGFKKTFVLLLVCAIIGDTLYALMLSPIIAIVGRTFAGVGSANLGMVFTYIALTTTEADRHKTMSIARLFSVVGLVFSPGLVFLLKYVNVTIGKYHCDQLNASGWVTDVFSIILIILIIIFLVEVDPPAPAPESQRLLAKEGTPINQESQPLAHSSKKLPRMYMSWAVATIFCCSFYNGFTGTSFEFMVTPITGSKYKWTPTDISLFMLVSSIVVIPVILLVMKLSSKYKTPERKWVLGSFFISFFGLTLCYLGTQGRFKLPHEWVGAILFCTGQTIGMNAYMILSVSLLPLSSKVVPPESRQVMMPWVNSCLAAGRLVGPMLTQYTYAVQDLGAQTEALFGSIMCLCTIDIILVSIFYSILVADSWKKKTPVNRFVGVND